MLGFTLPGLKLGSRPSLDTVPTHPPPPVGHSGSLGHREPPSPPSRASVCSVLMHRPCFVNQLDRALALASPIPARVPRRLKRLPGTLTPSRFPSCVPEPHSPPWDLKCLGVRRSGAGPTRPGAWPAGPLPATTLHARTRRSQSSRNAAWVGKFPASHQPPLAFPSHHFPLPFPGASAQCLGPQPEKKGLWTQSTLWFSPTPDFKSCTSHRHVLPAPCLCTQPHRNCLSL